MSTETVSWGGSQVLPGLRDALRCLITTDVDLTWQMGDGDVADGLTALAQARQLLDVAEVALVREGLTRGLPDEGSWSTHDWVSTVEGSRAPVPSTRHVAQVVRLAAASDARGGGLVEATQDAADRPATGPAAVAGALADGDLPLGAADQLLRFHQRVAPVADPELLADDTAALLEGARDEVIESGAEGLGARRVHGLSEKELAAAIRMTERLLKPERDLDREDERAKGARSLTKGPGPFGMSQYRLILEPEGAAVIDSALAALSGPVKGPDDAPDPRPATRRRADALVEIVRRGVSSPGEMSTGAKAQVVVTIGLDSLLGETGTGRDAPPRDRTTHGIRGTHGAGVTATGEVLPPSAVRRMACDGGIIPAVLGSDSEVLDLGRAVRWFTPGQKKALWLRDRGCTFPGCTMPPQWTDAHHVDWWSRRGGTDIANGALLCERHHTHVHTHDLTATITPTHVTWHL